MKNRWGFICVFCFSVLGILATKNFAAIINLKSGEKINAEIISKTDEYIKILFYGVTITYYWDQIASIEDSSSNTAANESSDSEQAPEQGVKPKSVDSTTGQQNEKKKPAPPESQASKRIILYEHLVKVAEEFDQIDGWYRAAEYYFKLSQAYKQLGDEKNQQKYIQKANKITGLAFSGEGRKAVVAEDAPKHGYYQKIIQACKEILAWDPKSVYAYLEQAHAYSILEMNEQAVILCSQAIDIDPENPDLYRARQNVYELMNNTAAAKADEQKIIELTE